MSIEDKFNKYVNQVYFKIRHSDKYIVFGGYSSTNSVVTFHKCGKNVHIQKYCKYNRNGSDGDSSETPTRKLQKWVTNKPIVSVVIYLTKSTMIHKRKKYK